MGCSPCHSASPCGLAQALERKYKSVWTEGHSHGVELPRSIKICPYESIPSISIQSEQQTDQQSVACRVDIALRMRK